MSLTLVTAPTEEPVTLAEAKTHLRVDGTADDTLITSQIEGARLWCEQRARRAFVTQTWRLGLDQFPDGCNPVPGLDRVRVPEYLYAIQIPLPTLKGVASVKYFDLAGADQTVDPANYAVDADREPGLVAPAYGKSWPVARPGPNSVRVQFTCGYGAATAVDRRARQAILLLVGHWYANRETIVIGDTSEEIELAACSLLDQLWHGAMGG